MNFLSPSPPPPELPGRFLMCFQLPHLVLTHLPGSCVDRGKGKRIQRLTLDLGWPAGCRLPRGCRHHLVSPSAALKATTDLLAERFTTAALDRPSGKLIAVNSQQIEPYRLVSWPQQWAPWLPSLITPAGPLCVGQSTDWWKRERRKAEREERGLTQNSTPLSGCLPNMCQETGSHLFVVNLLCGLSEILMRQSTIKFSLRPSSANWFGKLGKSFHRAGTQFHIYKWENQRDDLINYKDT